MRDLKCRLATPADHPKLRRMFIDSFEPITWYKNVDATFGPLHGHDWHARWEQRLDKIIETQIILVGELDGEIAAAATGTVTPPTKLGYIDLLAVDLKYQRQGLGRAMLRGMLDHFRSVGAGHAHLDCLTGNAGGNALYESEGWSLLASSNHYMIGL